MKIPSRFGSNVTVNFCRSHITIRFDGSEYRVPGPDRTEAQACYTDDRQDAIDTAKAVFGQSVKLRFKRVACADPDFD